MMYSEDDFLQLSGLQHFRFCRRQWALIHIEQLWSENLLTVEGEILHTRAHNATLKEFRGGALIVRDMRIRSFELGLSGSCDVVEFRLSENGVPIAERGGLYLPYPVEYKHGAPRDDGANELQLCAQAMCLEEMLCCDVMCGALFFGKTAHRKEIIFTEKLRQEVWDASEEMHRLYERKYTPKVKRSKACNSCSLKEQCLPKLMNERSVKSYLQSHEKE